MAVEELEAGLGYISQKLDVNSGPTDLLESICNDPICGVFEFVFRNYYEAQYTLGREGIERIMLESAKSRGYTMEDLKV